MSAIQSQPKILNRCPSCGHDTLVIYDGWLRCTRSECAEPNVQNVYDRALTAAARWKLDRSEPKPGHQHKVVVK